MGSLIQLAKWILPASTRQKFKTRLMREFQVPSMEWSLENMRRLGFEPTAAVDIGAFEGQWTAMFKRIFPKALCLMIEAQEDKRAKLEAIKHAYSGSVDYRVALLGSEERDGVVFNQYESAPTASSVLRDQRSSAAKSVVCRMRTLDKLLNETGVTRPGLLKLDVQGYELEILKGAPATLAVVEAVLMEVSLIELYQGNPLLHDVTRFMETHHFLTYDISTLVRRPLDQALCQVDIIFARKDSFLFKAKTWE